MNIPERGKYLAPRNIAKVFIIGGMHGNERTGVHAVRYIKEHLSEFKTGSISDIHCLFGNPRAIERNSRYIEKDLNRCFKYDYANPGISQKAGSSYEENRALEIRAELDALETPADFVLDLHTTTSKMGNCLIVPDNEPWTEYLCCLLTERIPDSTVLYEPVTRENEVTSSSLGLNQITLEMGSVPQGVSDYTVLENALSFVKIILKSIDELNGKSNLQNLLESKSITKYIRGPFDIDYPRDENGFPTAMIHRDFSDHLFKPLVKGQPVFSDLNRGTIHLEPGPLFPEKFCRQISEKKVVPLFIGEAAYVEKGIAFITALESTSG